LVKPLENVIHASCGWPWAQGPECVQTCRSASHVLVLPWGMVRGVPTSEKKSQIPDTFDVSNGFCQ
jgi:hypothetical protein